MMILFLMIAASSFLSGLFTALAVTRKSAWAVVLCLVLLLFFLMTFLISSALFVGLPDSDTSVVLADFLLNDPPSLKLRAGCWSAVYSANKKSARWRKAEGIVSGLRSASAKECFQECEDERYEGPEAKNDEGEAEKEQSVSSKPFLEFCPKIRFLSH